MRFLYTLDELLTLETNGWSCPPCGKTWLDSFPGVWALAFPSVPGFDPECRHPQLQRATLTVERG